MEKLLRLLVIDQQLLHLEETEVIMERSVCTVSAPASHLQLEGSVVEYLMLPVTITSSVLMLVSIKTCVFAILSVPIYVSVSVQITDGGVTPTVGQSYNLNCSTPGTSVMTFHWIVNGEILHGQTREVLSFSPLRLSDAGKYTCNVTVNSMIYSSSKTITLQSK